MLKSFIFYINLLFALLATVPEMLRLQRRKPTMTKEAVAEYAYSVAKRYAKAQYDATGSTVELIGGENVPASGPCLFVSNHQGYFDIAIFLAYVDREKGFIAKTEISKIPILRTWMWDIRCIFMDRSDIKKAAKAITEGIQTLKSGYCLVVFPEGTRSKGGPVGEFKAGSFKLATKAKAPIVPVTIDGAADIMEKNGGKIAPRHVRIVVHPPVDTAGLTADEVTALPDKVRETIVNGFL